MLGGGWRAWSGGARLSACKRTCADGADGARDGAHCDGRRRALHVTDRRRAAKFVQAHARRRRAGCALQAAEEAEREAGRNPAQGQQERGISGSSETDAPKGKRSGGGGRQRRRQSKQGDGEHGAQDHGKRCLP
jgi:hypothetical protein